MQHQAFHILSRRSENARLDKPFDQDRTREELGAKPGGRTIIKDKSKIIGEKSRATHACSRSKQCETAAVDSGRFLSCPYAVKDTYRYQQRTKSDSIKMD